jgi:hypothetical protein
MLQPLQAGESRDAEVCPKMAVLYVYLAGVMSHWWWFMTSGPIVVEAVASQMWQGYESWIDRYVTRTNRWRVIFCLAILGIFIASYQAFDDVYRQLQVAQAQLMDRASSVGTWERLTDDQKKTLIAILRKRQERIVISCNDSGCLGLEKDFVDVFQSAGWTQTNGASIDAIATGIFVEGAKGNKVAKALQDVIHRVTGLPVGYFEEPGGGSYTAIIIGTKPL